MASAKAKFDLIIDTVPYVYDINQYLPSLSLNGTLVLVRFLGNLEPTLNTFPLIMRLMVKNMMDNKEMISKFLGSNVTALNS